MVGTCFRTTVKILLSFPLVVNGTNFSLLDLCLEHRIDVRFKTKKKSRLETFLEKEYSNVWDQLLDMQS